MYKILYAKAGEQTKVSFLHIHIKYIFSRKWYCSYPEWENAMNLSCSYSRRQYGKDCYPVGRYQSGQKHVNLRRNLRTLRVSGGQHEHGGSGDWPWVPRPKQRRSSKCQGTVHPTLMGWDHSCSLSCFYWCDGEEKGYWRQGLKGGENCEL